MKIAAFLLICLILAGAYFISVDKTQEIPTEPAKEPEIEPLNDESTEGVFILYSRPNAPIRSTVVGRYNSITNEICFAAARCSKKEQFCKLKGRNIAIRRLNSGECIQSSKVPEGDTTSFTFVWVARNLAIWLETNARPVA
jgi:hypothetical protein